MRFFLFEGPPSIDIETCNGFAHFLLFAFRLYTLTREDFFLSSHLMFRYRPRAHLFPPGMFTIACFVSNSCLTTMIPHPLPSSISITVQKFNLLNTRSGVSAVR